jgi:hypothetical protein
VNVLTSILRTYVAETSMDHLTSTLKKGGIKDLLMFFPPNRRSDAIIDAHFRGAGLPQVADWWTRKQNALIKEDIGKAVKDAFEREGQPSDVRPVLFFSFLFFFELGSRFFFFSSLIFSVLRRSRSSLLCAVLLRSVRSPSRSSSRASGRASWLKSTGAHAQTKSRAWLCAKSRCVIPPCQPLPAVNDG